MELDYKFTVQDILDQGRTTKEDLEAIRDWVSELDDENVPSRIQDETLILFLLSCFNDIELTKTTIIAYYKCKKTGPEIHDDWNIKRSDIQMALNTVHLSSIPVRTDQNYAIHYFKINDTNYNNFELLPAMKISYMLVDITQEKNPPNGLLVLIDMKGIGLMHMTKLKIGALKKYLQFLQEGLPVPIKVIHIINAVYFIDKIMAIVKVFMKSELINILKIHPPGLAQEELFEMIPKKCLPMEYGGDLPSEKELHETTLLQFKDRQEFWNLEEKLRKQSR